MNKTFRVAIRIAVIALLGYVAVVVVFLVFESRLVYPVPPLAVGDWDPSLHDAEEVQFESSDSIRLHGWYLEHPDPQGVLLFCHGNGEHVGFLGRWADELRREHRVSVFIFDYRGYGKSQGHPDEKGLLLDGEAAQQWLADRARVRPDQIVIHGRSLGGAVAIHLAGKNGARGLIIERTFDSMAGLAADLYRWLPVDLMMRNRYESLKKISAYRGPLLQLHGAADTLVPIESAKRLFDAAGSTEKRFVEMPGIGHNDPTPAAGEREIGRFIESLK